MTARLKWLPEALEDFARLHDFLRDKNQMRPEMPPPLSYWVQNSSPNIRVLDGLCRKTTWAEGNGSFPLGWVLM